MFSYPEKLEQLAETEIIPDGVADGGKISIRAFLFHSAGLSMDFGCGAIKGD